MVCSAYFLLCLVLISLCYASQLGADLVLAEWTKNDSPQSRPVFALLYATCMVLHVVLIVGASAAVSYGGRRASSSAHSDSVQSLLRAPMSW